MSTDNKVFDAKSFV